MDKNALKDIQRPLRVTFIATALYHEALETFLLSGSAAFCHTERIFAYIL
jgi:hypothetical protein